MAKYRDREIINAIQWDGQNTEDIEDLLRTSSSTSQNGERLYVGEGDSKEVLEIGDWVVQFSGYFTTKSDRIFQATYEEVKVSKKKKKSKN